ncbi:MAG: hypothetical protein RL217_2174 [Pseudomonadota bacterium]|jgi:hypothetical protein
MRALFFVLTLFLAGCLAEDKKDPPPALNQLNGFWNGQFDQAGSLRVLLYEGEVFMRDASMGYYGSLTYSAADQRAALRLTSYTLGLNDTDAQQYATTGAGQAVAMNGLFYTGAALPQLVGDYQASVNGSFILTQDGTWANPSAFSYVAGQWHAQGLDLRINAENQNKVEFKAISAQVAGSTAAQAGCTFSGDLRLIDVKHPLYRVSLKERKGCADFNQVAEGFAAINAAGLLEFYLRSGSSLLFMIFQPGAEPAPAP